MTEKDLHVNPESKVTIQRGKHDRENPYTMISKKMLRDPALSPRDKGALCYLLSLPDSWVIHPRHVAEALGISKNQFYSILKCLIVAGYATKTEVKSKEGRFFSVCYSFFEEKLEIPQEVKKESTVSQKPDTEKPCTENPDTVIGTLKNTNLKEDRERKNTTTIPPKPKDAEPKSRSRKSEDCGGGGISFNRQKKAFDNQTPEIMKALAEAFPDVNIAQQLKEMVLWLLANPYRSGTQAFITKWLKKSMQDKSGFASSSTPPAYVAEEEPVVEVDPEFAKLMKQRDERIKREMQERGSPHEG